jgi:hypothetical protein
VKNFGVGRQNNTIRCKGCDVQLWPAGLSQRFNCKSWAKQEAKQVVHGQLILLTDCQQYQQYLFVDGRGATDTAIIQKGKMRSFGYGNDVYPKLLISPSMKQ